MVQVTFEENNTLIAHRRYVQRINGTWIVADSATPSWPSTFMQKSSNGNWYETDIKTFDFVNGNTSSASVVAEASATYMRLVSETGVTTYKALNTVTVSDDTITITGANPGVYVDWNTNLATLQESIDVNSVTIDTTEGTGNNVTTTGLQLDAGIKEVDQIWELQYIPNDSYFKWTGAYRQVNGNTYGVNWHYYRDSGGGIHGNKVALDYFKANTKKALTHSLNASYMEDLGARIVKANGITLVDVDEGNGEVWIETSPGKSYQEWDDGWGIARGIDHIGTVTQNPDHSSQFLTTINGVNRNFYNTFDGIETALEEAFDRGYDNGYEDGYKQGYADGFDDGVNSVAN